MLIDAHTHAWNDRLAKGAVASLAEGAHITAYGNGTVDDLRSRMKEEGVSKFCVLNIAVSPRTERHVNDFALSLLSCPEIIPFGSVHPDSENALSELDRLSAAGIRGVKFHNEYQNFLADDEKAFPLYEKCAEKGLVMVFHAGADRGFSPPFKAGPERIAHIQRTFPRARIVAAHLGGMDMTEEAVRLLSGTGAYVDTAFSSKFASAAQIRRIVDAFGADRVLFGTDFPWDTPGRTLAHLSAAGLTEEETERIAWKNAAALFEIAP